MWPQGGKNRYKEKKRVWGGIWNGVPHTKLKCMNCFGHNFCRRVRLTGEFGWESHGFFLNFYPFFCILLVPYLFLGGGRFKSNGSFYFKVSFLRKKL